MCEVIFLRKIIIFILLVCALFLFSCKKTEEPDAQKLCDELNSVIGKGIIELNSGVQSSYLAGIPEGSTEKVGFYKVYTEEIGVSGYELTVIRAESGFTDEIYKEMSAEFEFAPCDPAEKATVLNLGNTVIRIKGSMDEVDAVEDRIYKIYGSEWRYLKSESFNGA